MKYINSDNNLNTISYYSRYNMVHKWEIYDHSTKIEVTGSTFVTISGDTSGSTTYLSGDGIIVHIIDYSFTENNLYTYKSYYNLNYNIENSSPEYYLCTHILLSTDKNDRVEESYNLPTKSKNTFKIRK